jgi:L-fucose mutarotase/ribose pyranase (RbsD/FucU family)
LLKNEYWLEAMEFTKDACNLSNIDETKFVEKYIIDECEEMVKGLEEIFHKEHFSFKDRAKNHYTKDKKGHVLIEFRGEKISGALDFISKILEFDEIASIQSFIKRIESSNKKIQPILAEESEIIKIKLSNLNTERNELKPTYDKVVNDNVLFNNKKTELQKRMISNGELDSKQIDTVKLNNQFQKENPDYSDFLEEFKSVTESYRILNEQIHNLTKICDNIILYKKKILEYFKP